MRNWTEEELVLLLKKRSERLLKMSRSVAREVEHEDEYDDDGVLIGVPDFIRNRVAADAFNAKLAAGRNFRGYDVSITPQQIPVKEVNHA